VRRYTIQHHRRPLQQNTGLRDQQSQRRRPQLLRRRAALSTAVEAPLSSRVLQLVQEPRQRRIHPEPRHRLRLPVLSTTAIGISRRRRSTWSSSTASTTCRYQFQVGAAYGYNSGFAVDDGPIAPSPTARSSWNRGVRSASRTRTSSTWTSQGVHHRRDDAQGDRQRASTCSTPRS
jgi:hypothetical protein